METMCCGQLTHLVDMRERNLSEMSVEYGEAAAVYTGQGATGGHRVVNFSEWGRSRGSSGNTWKKE